jgi:hypothetical protein
MLKLKAVLQKLKRTLIKFAIISAMMFPTIALGAQVCWIPPTEREDNTPLPAGEIAGYHIYTAAGEQWVAGLITDTCVIIDETISEVSGYVKTVDSDGRQSRPSETFTIPMFRAVPNPPTVITVIVSP